MTLLNMLGAFVAMTHSAAFGYDALDDDESGIFTDDGAPEGNEADAVPVCSLEDTSQYYMGWDLTVGAQLTLPPAGVGNSWDLVYSVSNTDYTSGWTDLDQGDESASTDVVLSLPTSVLNAAAVAPLALEVRAQLVTGTTVLGVHHVDWLIVDNRGSGVEYEGWDLHEWPTLGTGEPVTDLDYEPGTEIQISGGSGFVSYVRFCVQLTTSHSDVGNVYVPGAATRDHFTTNGLSEARGHWLFARGPSTSNLSTRLSDEAVGNLPAGCGLLSLRRGETYDIWVKADVDVRNQDLTVRHSDTKKPWIGILRRAYVVPNDHVLDPPVQLVKNATHQAWNTSIVASWALHRRAVNKFHGVRILTDQNKCDTTPCSLGKRVYMGIAPLVPLGPVRTCRGPPRMGFRSTG